MRLPPPLRRNPWLPAALGAAALLSVMALSACATRVPQGVEPVDFDVDRYAGHWYEVARIDHFFEKGLVRTSADYSRNADGTVTVINRGFDPARQKWKQSVGKVLQAGKGGLSGKDKQCAGACRVYHIVGTAGNLSVAEA